MTQITIKEKSITIDQRTYDVNENVCKALNEFIGKVGVINNQQPQPSERIHKGRYWYPESENDVHWIINGVGIAWEGVMRTILRADYGNCFPTKEAAEKELAKRKAIVTIKRYISDTYGVFEPDWGSGDEAKFELFYNQSDSIFASNGFYLYRCYSPIGYFSCEEHAKDVITKFDKELRLIRDLPS